MNPRIWIAGGMVCLAAWSGFAGATDSRPAEEDISLRTTYRHSDTPLTTEKVWSLDAEESNPHRARWVLKRDLVVQGLRAVPLPVGGFAVRASAIESSSEGFVRAEGPWYRPPSEFRCTGEPISWFATRAGSLAAVDEAARVWQLALDESKLRLALQLRRVSADSEADAIAQGQRAFERWKREVESGWSARARAQARAAEWTHYQREARSEGRCSATGVALKKSPPAPTSASGGEMLSDGGAPVSWERMMEPPAATTPKLLVRTPLKRVNGFFTVRLSVTIGLHKYNGRFLVDSGAGMSVISPQWLEAQGILPFTIEVPGAPLRKITWSSLLGGMDSRSGGLARVALVEKVELGGLVLPVREFLLHETEVTAPPEGPGVCCDGILGSDFLRKYPVEFGTQTPQALRVFAPEGFNWGADKSWVEVSITGQGEPVSACTVRPSQGQGPGLFGVRWDSGSDGAVDVHQPWQAVVRKHGLSGWELSCGEQTIARDMVLSLPTAADGGHAGGPLGVKVPATNVGNAILARDGFVLDFPHGRIWFPNSARGLPSEQNRSGIRAEFQYIGPDRRLKVTALGKEPEAQAAARAGLRVGDWIERLNGLRIAELDQWEVNHVFGRIPREHTTISWLEPFSRRPKARRGSFSEVPILRTLELGPPAPSPKPRPSPKPEEPSEPDPWVSPSPSPVITPPSYR